MIYRRGRSMRVMVYAGRDPLTGRKKWVSRQVPGTGRAALREAKQIEAKLLAAIHLRFGLPAELPDGVTKLIKRADKIAAYYEATCLAGFSRSEARRFFGQPRGLSTALVNRMSHMSPLPAAQGEAEFLKRFNELHRNASRRKT
mgnify:CR=1 FL=1